MPTACQSARDYIRSRPHKPAALNQFYTLSDQATHEAVHLLCRMLVLNPNKRITAADALTHPYLDEGRLRFHSCMCSCCTPGNQGRNFCPDLEPECPVPFDFNFEKSLTNVSRVKEKLYKFIHEHQQRSTNKLPLCLNPHAAALAKIQREANPGRRTRRCCLESTPQAAASGTLCHHPMGASSELFSPSSILALPPIQADQCPCVGATLPGLRLELNYHHHLINGRSHDNRSMLTQDRLQQQQESDSDFADSAIHLGHMSSSRGFSNYNTINSPSAAMNTTAVDNSNMTAAATTLSRDLPA
ncbi:mitogen-activated protein kinase [Plakobranchus ocellatus]|uniref:Mitogen-activated protein kinase n=1 Tax=Plakobranchus ocellatus TaxID=259542 RepID=A0AAV4DGI0_9GAST|nr:mitogen-activated protein kinase [Plakobranchus ocellatus]